MGSKGGDLISSLGATESLSTLGIEVHFSVITTDLNYVIPTW